jgi:hypothetical protein
LLAILPGFLTRQFDEPVPAAVSKDTTIKAINAAHVKASHDFRQCTAKVAKLEAQLLAHEAAREKLQEDLKESTTLRYAAQQAVADTTIELAAAYKANTEPIPPEVPTPPQAVSPEDNSPGDEPMGGDEVLDSASKLFWVDFKKNLTPEQIQGLDAHMGDFATSAKKRRTAKEQTIPSNPEELMQVIAQVGTFVKELALAAAQTEQKKAAAAASSSSSTAAAAPPKGDTQAGPTPGSKKAKAGRI